MLELYLVGNRYELKKLWPKVKSQPQLAYLASSDGEMLPECEEAVGAVSGD